MAAKAKTDETKTDKPEKVDDGKQQIVLRLSPENKNHLDFLKMGVGFDDRADFVVHLMQAFCESDEKWAEFAGEWWE